MRIRNPGIDKTLKKLDKLPGEIQTVLKESLNDALNEIGIETAKHLQGPGPKRLNIYTSRLIRSFLGRYSFNQSRGMLGGIHQIIVQGNKIIGIKGTKVKSKQGFDYPARWEFGGTSIIKPGAQGFLAFPIGQKVRYTKGGKARPVKGKAGMIWAYTKKPIIQKGPRPFLAPAVAKIKPQFARVYFKSRLHSKIKQLGLN